MRDFAAIAWDRKLNGVSVTSTVPVRSKSGSRSSDSSGGKSNGQSPAEIWTNRLVLPGGGGGVRLPDSVPSPLHPFALALGRPAGVGRWKGKEGVEGNPGVHLLEYLFVVFFSRRVWFSDYFCSFCFFYIW